MKKDYKHFNDSVFFDIEQISRYISILGKEFFDNLQINLTNDEFRTLDVILCNPDICQRDLAKLILRDRTRAGRILDSLEKKGCIERFNDTKGKRLVRKFKITEKGVEKYELAFAKLKPRIDKMAKRFSEEDANNLKKRLQELLKIVSEHVKLDI